MTKENTEYIPPAKHLPDTAPSGDFAAGNAVAGHSRGKKEVIREGFRNKTKGEAWFNGISYIGIGYGLVTATSVFMTWLLHDTPWFSKKFGGFATKITERFGWPQSIANIGTLFAGGTIVSVLPVKWLEDKKPEIVKRLDSLFYSDDERKDPKIKASHKELDELPRQTWLSVFGSRIIAFVATFSIFFLIGSNKSRLAEKTGHSIDSLSIRFGRWFDGVMHGGNPEIVHEIGRAIKTNHEKMHPDLGDKALKGLEVIRDKVGGDRIASRVWSYISLDAFYTIITSALLFVFTRVLGGLLGRQPDMPVHPELPHMPRTATDDRIAVREVAHEVKADIPQPEVTQKSYIERVANPAYAPEITA